MVLGCIVQSNINNRSKGRLAEACVKLEVYGAGYLVPTTENLNDEGVDLTVGRPKSRHRRAGSVLDIQVKAVQVGTGRIRIAPHGYNYDLDTETYNNLMDPDLSVSTLALVVVVLPSDSNWLIEDEEKVKLRCERYMPDLKDKPVSSNKHTTAIQLRKDQPFNSHTLAEFIESIRKVRDV